MPVQNVRCDSRDGCPYGLKEPLTRLVHDLDRLIAQWEDLVETSHLKDAISNMRENLRRAEEQIVEPEDYCSFVLDSLSAIITLWQNLPQFSGGSVNEDVVETALALMTVLKYRHYTNPGDAAVLEYLSRIEAAIQARNNEATSAAIKEARMVIDGLP